MKNFLIAATVCSICIIIVRGVIEWITDSEMEPIKLVASGVASGVTYAAFLHWWTKRKSNSDVGDSQE